MAWQTSSLLRIVLDEARRLNHLNVQLRGQRGWAGGQPTLEVTKMQSNNPTDKVDYGPLAALVGTWRGDKGMDVSPEPGGAENNPYFEVIHFDASGQVTNAQAQTLAVLRYHQVVSRKSDDAVFHNETGYWMWDAGAGLVMQSLTIPRGVCLIAGGVCASDATPNASALEVHAAINVPDGGIVQSPFMRERARTVEFHHTVTVSDGEMTYRETILLDIYGRQFEHTDENSLLRT